VLSQEQTLPSPKPDVFKPQGLEKTRISFDADPEFLALYEEMKNLQGRPDWEMNDRLKDAMKVVLKKKKRDLPEKNAKSTGWVERVGSEGSRAEASGSKELGSEIPESKGSKSEGFKSEIPKPEGHPSKLAVTPITSSPPDRSSPVLRAQKVTLQQKHEAGRNQNQNQNQNQPKSPPKKNPAPGHLKDSLSLRYFPASVKQSVRARSGNQCEFMDEKTKRRCTSRFALEFDHILPFAKGGASTLENCRHLCAGHNRFAAVREFGRAKMDRYSART
jgi:hypothetical protein